MKLSESSGSLAVFIENYIFKRVTQVKGWVLVDPPVANWAAISGRAFENNGSQVQGANHLYL